MSQMIVDSQVHIWAADRPDRPWPAGNAHRAHRPVPLSYEPLLAEMDEAGVDKAILVPPSYEGDWNDLVLEAAREYPHRFAIMGRLPIQDSACARMLHAWRSQPGMLGLRLTFHVPDMHKLLENGAVDWFWPAAERLGVPIYILPTGALHHIRRIAARHPGLSITIDHCALHRFPGQPFHVDPGEIDQLVALSAFPNVAVKVSALPLFSNEPYPFRDIQALVRRVFDGFGPRRTFWGSDLTRLPCSYRQAVTMFTEALPWLKGEDKELVMGRALCAWLGWDGQPAVGPAAK